MKLRSYFMVRYKYPVSLTTSGEWARVRTIITDDIRSYTNLKQNAEPETCLSPYSSSRFKPVTRSHQLQKTTSLTPADAKR